ncbi:hypothetical protein EV421DRAFT_1743352 [Armillaria borealis]|uniref:Uncharacterized protein n=1 Tax=Armillaria borealis TaxID=47425 RepID=A0AA39IWP8_9AGAR|nr:hypothetical protein EV421DRAFT_1743352 [Armillaria borealis]
MFLDAENGGGKVVVVVACQQDRIWEWDSREEDGWSYGSDVRHVRRAMESSLDAKKSTLVSVVVGHWGPGHCPAFPLDLSRLPISLLQFFLAPKPCPDSIEGPASEYGAPTPSSSSSPSLSSSSLCGYACILIRTADTGSDLKHSPTSCSNSPVPPMLGVVVPVVMFVIVLVPVLTVDIVSSNKYEVLKGQAWRRDEVLLKNSISQDISRIFLLLKHNCCRDTKLAGCPVLSSYECVLDHIPLKRYTDHVEAKLPMRNAEFEMGNLHCDQIGNAVSGRAGYSVVNPMLDPIWLSGYLVYDPVIRVTTGTRLRFAALNLMPKILQKKFAAKNLRIIKAKNEKFPDLRLYVGYRDMAWHVHPIPLEPRAPSPSPPRTALPLPLPPKQQTPPPPPSKQWLTAPVTPHHVATKPTLDLDIPMHKLKLTAPSPDTSTSKVQVPTKTVSSARAQAAPKPPVPDTLTSNVNVAKTPVPNLTKPANQTGQQTAPLQKKVTPRLLNLGAILSSKAMPPSSTAPKKLASSMKPKVLAPPSEVTTSLPIQTGADNSGPMENFVSFSKDFTSPLHEKSGPDPSLQHEGTGPHRPSKRTPLFFPGTDEDEEQIQDDLVKGEQVVGTDGEDNNFQAQDYDTPTPPRDVLMDVDKNEGQQSDDDSSPPPTQSCHAAYLKMTQGSKSDLKKKKKDAKGKEKATRAATSRKPQADKPAPKKLKMKDTAADDNEVVQPTPTIRTRGPTPSKPPPVTLGISGGGFSEKVPPSAKQLENSIESIGVLKVDKDFGKFVEVDGRYWNKDVAPFVGECTPWESLPQDADPHCNLQPCKVDGEVALNPVSHYHPKGYDMINTFESALNTIEINNAAISSIAQQYLAGLNVSTHSESIRVQMSRLRKCLNPVEKVVEEEDNGDEDVKVKAVAEGVAGPSNKKKAKSG